MSADEREEGTRSAASRPWDRDSRPSDSNRETGTVRVNGIETYYERQGRGPPIVFVHGMFMNTTQWEPQVTTLSQEYTTVTYDVRGHGRTGGSERETYTVDLYADDLGALLAALDIERPVLCGLSMGGAIAQAYAARSPENVAGLVLADSFTAGSLPLTSRLFFANLHVFAILDRVVRYPTLNRLQMRVGNLLTPGVAGDSDAIQRIIDTPPRITHTEFVKIARSMARFPRVGLDLAAITVPTLLLHGEHLPAPFLTMSRQLAVELENAPVAVRAVPGAGHASNVDNPGYFTAQIREFLAQTVEADD